MKTALSGKNRNVLLQLFVAMAVFFVQFHFCRPAFLLPNGKECITCDALEHEDGHGNTPIIQAAEHGDCHDCCTVKECGEKRGDVAVVTSFSHFSFDIDLPVAFRQPVLPVCEQVSVLLAFSENCPSTGPPIARSSRAPPISDSRLSFA